MKSGSNILVVFLKIIYTTTIYGAITTVAATKIDKSKATLLSSRESLGRLNLNFPNFLMRYSVDPSGRTPSNINVQERSQ